MLRMSLRALQRGTSAATSPREENKDKEKI
jgi:hypothetical protein